ncbi:unnamed protein product [Spirodela intermedia]|uniref:Uncharacterized protein n=1 Tax=Spirodela intermedia TaxID=51605 RepID=A0A7I8KQI4_SPIIN|nr:unnamed protein product [Spirodela intermedia]
MALLLSPGVALGLLWVLCSFFLRWNELRSHQRRVLLPPGTMGWPVVGETIEFLRRGPDFLKKQRARYGSLFTSHLLGSPTVVSMDLEVNRWILMNEGRGLVPGYPQAMAEILGEWNVAAVHGAFHRVVRGALLSVVGPAAVRERLFPTLDEFIRSHLCDWGGSGGGGATVDVQEKAREMAFSSALKLIAGIETGEMATELKAEFFKLVRGTLSLAVDLPGTAYRRGLQARKRIIRLLRGLIVERRRSSPSVMKGGRDMLSLLLREEGEEEQDVHQTGPKLTDEQIIDLLISVIYSGFETVSTAATMAVKYLHDNTSALQELRKEYSEISRRKSPAEGALTWGDYTSMEFTRAVILETMRLATIVNGVLRKTTEDIAMNGFVVPKGWRIYVYTRESNYDSLRYPAPLRFDPWRWKDRSLENHQHFMMFGGGGRLCPGKELGLVQISLFLHYFLTRYRWEDAGGNEIVQFPRVEAPRGLHIRVWPN